MNQPIVLVTGCSKGGIGYALCEQFAKSGCRVFATARRLAALDGLEAFGCDKLELDITNAESIKATFEKIIEEAGHIDILVNNAGTPAVGALLDIEYDKVRACIDTNVIGTLSMCRVVGRHMADRGSGKIVNVGSVVGYASTPWAGIYALSKAAVHAMTDSLRLELKPFGIQVIVVAPGAIRSNIGVAGTETINIPPDSLYKKVSTYIYKRATMSQGPDSTPNTVFAAHVVGQVLRRDPPRYITFGAKSFAFVLFYYLPHFVKDYVMSKLFGINELKKLQ
ncbi:uncharacterized protein BYT42DRAFT_583211 [Radiomyces spectabilis]|uniref:uncharacterized protein n=1 Tax=Radiomyces spectabilis TaxID=64574 RepID=UPI00221FAC8F|nr:uncharacterized protein BYT42DRAFT_583211 [Radiomyces spectabilis]KAI8370655.1 hypothetical protein BYT42DRAFT_583211 [Radiomyces spectabilis]